MDKYEEFMALTSQAIGILKDMSKRSPYDMASDGMARKTARNFTQLSGVLFGPTDSPRLQRESVALAEERGLSLEYLEMVEKHARKLKKRGAAWRLRAELIAFEGRSEEHTSELQSRGHLVCRLLLEKKNEKEENDAAIGHERGRVDPVCRFDGVEGAEDVVVALPTRVAEGRRPRRHLRCRIAADNRS